MADYTLLFTTLFAEDFSSAADPSLKFEVESLLTHGTFRTFLQRIVKAPVFEESFGRAFADTDNVGAIAPARMLRSALNLPVHQVLSLLAQIAVELGAAADPWLRVSQQSVGAGFAAKKLAAFLTEDLRDQATRSDYRAMIESLIETNPHAVYPTSPYRECSGAIYSSADSQHVDAVITFQTCATISMKDHILEPHCEALKAIYAPLGRCVCFVDQNVDQHFGHELDGYFKAAGITFEKRVYRAMEVDKGLQTVECMLGDLKRLGIARHEPVLIVGGGVLADTAGLACALYGRNTPYVMLATSIVSGIDAGPSPRTCCDGFGYKNLLGAYHPPTAFFVDRFFFKTLHEGWMRHGIAEIIKIATVKNAELFADLERAPQEVMASRFGTVAKVTTPDIDALSQRIIAGALHTYIQAEYENLYETHQCRPHAFGHTWSPGFEISAGLLHGHAVAIDMGFGAFIAQRAGWIQLGDFERIMRVMSAYGLSLWHEILNDDAVLLESHRKIIQKRGGNLVAPLPKSSIGRCGYFNDLSVEALFAARNEYHSVCKTYPREGLGVDPLCSDVGLEHPAAAARPLIHV